MLCISTISTSNANIKVKTFITVGNYLFQLTLFIKLIL
eukprot:UN10690